MENNRELTKAELEIMQVIWANENIFLADIISKISEPRPAYTTVSTVIRTLVKKGFVSFKGYGKSFCYFTTISKEEYTVAVMSRVKRNFFDGSVSNMISFFSKKEKLSPEQRAELMELLEQDE